MDELMIRQNSDPTIPALVLTGDIEARLAAYAAASRGAFAKNTERAVRADLAVFAGWCTEHGVPSCPASPATVAAFLDDMASTRKVSTLRRYVASIAHLHRAAGLDTPTGDSAVRLRLRALARAAAEHAQEQARPVKEQAEGITQRDVDRIVATAGSTPRDLRDVALLLVGRDLLARRAELVALRVEDITRAEDGTGTATVRRSKVDQAGEGADCFLGHETMVALDRWLSVSGITTGPLFRSLRKGGRGTERALDAGEVSAILKALANRARLAVDRVQRVSGHSLRVGMAQDLVAAGLDLPAVMVAGRWKSPTMVASYARKLLAGRGAVAQYHAKRG
jgi:integrase